MDRRDATGTAQAQACDSDHTGYVVSVLLLYSESRSLYCQLVCHDDGPHRRMSLGRAALRHSPSQAEAETVRVRLGASATVTARVPLPLPSQRP
eukprot:2016102-Rhodomonas_salina.2